MSEYKRTREVIVTNEARVLRLLRKTKGLSMRQAGTLIGKSDTYICHIENGRMDVPQGDKLDQLLGVYGGIKIRSFQERVRLYRHQREPREELLDLVTRLSDDMVHTAIAIMGGLLTETRKI